ncbi:sigma 54-interacting transcriptional regulator [uncultured Desulfobacter sp.]|uniref:sigma-54 interaction domain-containing protein n=1 Tax=uncultured Desulfobacter sp. TaxID=240139 RepID=UPI002AAA7557|nr:sigma 54-interacting transcriptional regulator [uncultured Desulfobacter sp.]
MENIQQAIEKNKLLKRFLESMGDGVFVLDPTGKIVAWNPAMEAITGYSSREIKGKSCRILKFSKCFGKDCPSGMHDCKILQTGKVIPTECVISHRNGHLLEVSKNARVIRDDSGQIMGVIETVTDLTELKNTRLKIEQAARRLGELNRLGGIIAKSEVMQNVFSFIKASAACETSIFIQGESGTGKELVAGAIHSIGERKDKPMITVNCSALSESLLESELFGHVKGAFTGAVRDRIGRFEQADQGTIFLDEIGEISPYIQIKLLRVLQEKEIERVGDSKKHKVNIRIITATNKDLKSRVDEGFFREDLYYRLKVFPIYLPPLRNRREDIPLLVDHFIKLNNKISGQTVTGMAEPARKVFMKYSWPGNIRELANAIEHAFVLCSDNQIDLKDLPLEISGQNTTYAAPLPRYPKPASPRKKQRESLDRDSLLTILTESGWNKAEAARRSGFSRAAIWKYMKKWNIPMQSE